MFTTISSNAPKKVETLSSKEKTIDREVALIQSFSEKRNDMSIAYASSSFVKPWVSIIVPVYDVVQYLPRCLDSIKAQTLTGIECIIVDDGAMDGSGKIIDDYVSSFPNLFKVVHQPNQGQGRARNVGIDTASGEYIGFVDSDDWIEPEMFSNLYETAKEKNHDLVICDYDFVYSDGSSKVGERP